MKKRLSTYLLALIAGAIMPFAFAPNEFYILSVLCPAFLLYTWLSASPRQAFIYGLLFGLGMFGIGVSWVYVSVHEFGSSSTLFAVLITTALVIYLSLFPATQGYLLNRFFPENNKFKILFVFAASTALFEWVRSWLLSGFPWLYLAHSQVHSPLAGFIPVLGPIGTTFIVALCSGLLVLILKSKFRNVTAFVSLIAVWVIGLSMTQFQWTFAEDDGVKISIIQGNIPQDIKWSPDQFDKTIDKYWGLTKKHWDSDIIVWPEAAIPGSLNYAKNIIEGFANAARENDTTLVIGIPSEANDRQYYNSMIAIGADNATYHKRHLVPFGEFVPLQKLFNGLFDLFNIPISDFISGPIKQPDFVINGLKITPLVCYEIAFGKEILRSIKDSNFIITLSNNAWFGKSYAPDQSLEIAQFQAIATGRYLISSTNDGISATINPVGDIQQKIPQFEEGVLTDTIYPVKGTTPWVMMGNWPVIGLLLFGLVSPRILRRKDRNVESAGDQRTKSVS